jgi:hypothetical protein
MERAATRTIPSFRDRAAYAVDVDVPLGLPVADLLRDSNRILELGPGPCGWSWRRLLGSPRLASGVALERYSGYVARARAGSCWGSQVLGTATRLPFRDGAFDASVALDVVEHLEKPEGFRMLGEMKRVSKRRVVVMTPNGFLPQEGDENPWQRHRSGWTVDEFRALGFRVKGVRGPKFLRGEKARPRLRPAWLGVGLSLALSGPASWTPSRSFQLLAWWANESHSS